MVDWPHISAGNEPGAHTSHYNSALLFSMCLFHVSSSLTLSTVFNFEIGKAGSCSEHHLWEVWEDSCLQLEEIQSVWWNEWREYDRTFVQVRRLCLNQPYSVYFGNNVVCKYVIFHLVMLWDKLVSFYLVGFWCAAASVNNGKSFPKGTSLSRSRIIDLKD